MASEYKTCPACKRELLRHEWFYWRKNGARGMRWESYCKECCSLQNGAASPHYEKAKARHREWYVSNREEQLEKTRQRQPETYKRRLAAGYHMEASRLQRERLTDCYVRQTLAHSSSGIKKEQVTPELIALKREHIAVQRVKKIIQTMIKELHESGKDSD